MTLQAPILGAAAPVAVASSVATAEQTAAMTIIPSMIDPGNWAGRFERAEEVIVGYFERSNGFCEARRFTHGDDKLYAIPFHTGYDTFVPEIAGMGGAFVGEGMVHDVALAANMKASHAYMASTDSRIPFSLTPTYGALLALANDRHEFGFFLNNGIDTETASRITGIVQKHGPLNGKGNEILAHSTFKWLRAMSTHVTQKVATLSDEGFALERDMFLSGRVTGISSPVYWYAIDAANRLMTEKEHAVSLVSTGNAEIYHHPDLASMMDHMPPNGNSMTWQSIYNFYKLISTLPGADEAFITSSRSFAPTILEKLPDFMENAIVFSDPMLYAAQDVKLFMPLRFAIAEAMQHEPEHRLLYLTKHTDVPEELLAPMRDLKDMGMRAGSFPLNREYALGGLSVRSEAFKKLTPSQQTLFIRNMEYAGLIAKG